MLYLLIIYCYINLLSILSFYLSIDFDTYIISNNKKSRSCYKNGEMSATKILNDCQNTKNVNRFARMARKYSAYVQV